MMVSPRRAMSDNWSENSAINNEFIKNIMTGEKFLELWRNLWFREDGELQQYDMIQEEYIVEQNGDVHKKYKFRQKQVKDIKQAVDRCQWLIHEVFNNF